MRILILGFKELLQIADYRLFSAFQWNSGEIERDLGPYDALAHEMGHNFGFDDDKKGNVYKDWL